MNPKPLAARLRRVTHLSAFLVVATAACATAREPELDRFNRGAVLHVVNRGWSDVAVYLADGNVPRRLGNVGALDRALLRIPNQSAGMGVRLLVRAFGTSQTYAADVVVPGAGGVVELTVQPLLLASEVTVLSYGALER